MDDQIYRQAAIDAIRKDVMGGLNYEGILKRVPSAQTERTGRWIPDNNFYYETRFVCSECKESECVPTIGFTLQKPLWDYCPNCGARMDGGDKNAIS